MKKSTTTTAVNNSEIQVVNILLSQVVKSPLNPRKTHADEDINELAESIKEKGVIQPVTLRTAKKGTYEIVCGERRYLACLRAGKKDIPAMIREYTDEEVREIALIENVQRKDVLPTEEARALKEILELKGGDIKTLALQVSKPESEIKRRLKLNDLITGIADLLNSNKIDMTTAYILSELAQDVQENIFINHLQDETDAYNWRDLGRKELIKKIQSCYTTDLKLFMFDKTECAACGFNSNNQTLFPDGCGKCTNRNCMQEKNNVFMVEKAVQMLKEIPNLSLCVGGDANTDVLKRLEIQGYEVEEVNFKTYPETPEAPDPEDYECYENEDGENEVFQSAMECYQENKERHEEILQILAEKMENGEIVPLACITSKDIIPCYLTVISDTPVSSTIDLIYVLDKKDNRNREIMQEKIKEDTRVLVSNIEYKGDFADEEEKLMYYFMLSNLPPRHYRTLGIEKDYGYLNKEEKNTILSNLTVPQKTLITRDFIASALNGCYDNELVEIFTKLHNPEEVEAIKQKHLEVYEKRQDRIDERKAVLEVQKRKAEEAEKRAKAREQAQMAVA